MNGLAPSYLKDHIPDQAQTSMAFRRNHERVPLSRTERYDNSFFPYCINNWNDLDNSVKSLPSVSCFKNYLNNFIRPKGNCFYGLRDKFGVKLLTKIRVEFSDLRDHRYNHNFNCASPICSCGLEDETSLHFFLCCPRYQTIRQILLNKITEIVGSDISILPKDHLIHIIIYGSNVYNSVTNKLILEQSIIYICKSKRFKKLEAFASDA